jgi:hypothetical protein
VQFVVLGMLLDVRDLFARNALLESVLFTAHDKKSDALLGVATR